MIDLLKDYQELQKVPGYAGSLRYYIAKKRLDTIFLKWLSSNRNQVESLFSKAQNKKLKASNQPSPLFSHHKVPHQDTPNDIIAPPRSSPDSRQPVNLPGKKRENEREQNLLLSKSSKLSKTLKQQINSKSIPQFYFPQGKAADPVSAASVKAQINTIFEYKNEIDVQQCKKVVSEVLGLPMYFIACVMTRCSHEARMTRIQFNRIWKELQPHDIQKRAFLLITSDKNKKFLVIDDFKSVLKQVLDVHPSLAFLTDSPEFQEWYSICVINRMFFAANIKNDQQMSYREFKKSSILQSFYDLETLLDVNDSKDFFSYQDFYVIYIKFWELDNDHDFFLTKEELSKYSGYTLSRKTIQRVFSQVARKFQHPDKMTFGDFVWFIYCVEDKTTPQSLRYWFKILDLDNNGIVSGYELQYFYEEQSQRLAYMEGSSADFNFENIICQMVDLMKPVNHIQFTVQNFLERRLECGLFISFLTDLNKLVAFEERDAYEQKNQKLEHPEWSEWDRFVKLQYKRLKLQNFNEEDEEVLDWWNDEA